MTQTATVTIRRGDATLRRFGRLMRAVGLVGVVLGVAAIAVGLWLLRDLDTLLGRSLQLTGESLATVDSSLVVAADAVEVIGDGLAEAERTAQGLETSLDDGASLLDDAAGTLRGDVAGSLESVRRSMPPLIEVAGTIDATLRAIDGLPVGLAYEPDEPFDQTLIALQQDIDGLPPALLEQATAIELAGENLRQVSADGAAVAVAIGEVRVSLDDAGEILNRYRATASNARALLDETLADLGRRLLVLRILVVVLGLVYCAGQALPVYLGHWLADASGATEDVQAAEAG